MKKQGLIEGAVGILGILLWVIWANAFPSMWEFWVYVPAILFGFISIFMWKHRDNYKVEEKMKKAYRNANIIAFIGGAIFGIISYLAIKDLEWFTWGNWFVVTMYAFCFCHGGGLIQFRDRERLKSMGEE